MMMEEKAENKWWVNEYLVRKIKTEVDYQELDAAGLVKFLKTDKEKEETKTVTSYDDHGQQQQSRQQRKELLIL